MLLGLPAFKKQPLYRYDLSRVQSPFWFDYINKNIYHYNINKPVLIGRHKLVTDYIHFWCTSLIHLKFRCSGPMNRSYFLLVDDFLFRLPPCLEELVDMRQTDAGGRIVLPREHQQHERRKSIGNCIM